MSKRNRAGYAQLSGCGLNLLTDDEVAELHRATLDVLENCGLRIYNDEAQEIFYSHGCRVDKETATVKIPSYLVEEAINSVPKKVTLAGRKPEDDVVLGGTRVHNTNFGVAVKVLDLETGKTSESTNKHLAEVGILVDALDSLDVFFQPLTPRDTPAEVQDLYAAETCLTNCSKHFICGEIMSTNGARRFHEMGVAIMGSAEELRRRPIISTVSCPVSPLQLSGETCEVIIESARLGLSDIVITETMAGATSPATLAGAIIVHNAEVLGDITLSQLTKRGAAKIMGSSSTILDLSYVVTPMGSPETALFGAAVAKLAQYYRIPSFAAGT